MAIKFPNKKKLFLLDQDGTLYNGNTLFSGTKKFLDDIKAHNAEYVFVTNNSSKSVDDYIKKLAGLGIEANKHQFFTSTEATIMHLKSHYPGLSVYPVGTTSFINKLLEEGVIIKNHLQADIALLAYDTELTYQKLANLSEMLLKRDVPYIATNPDFVCPIEFGSVPDCGSFIEMIEHATKKRPLIIGKPNKNFLDLALKKYGVRREEAVMIGDRLYTDIQSAYNSSITSILTLEGEATMADVEKYPIKPDYIIQSISDVFD
ncbi:MAG: HAD-IIA family hydrolase [Bacilli bacterium]